MPGTSGSGRSSSGRSMQHTPDPVIIDSLQRYVVGQLNIRPPADADENATAKAVHGRTQCVGGLIYVIEVVLQHAEDPRPLLAALMMANRWSLAVASGVVARIAQRQAKLAKDQEDQDHGSCSSCAWTDEEMRLVRSVLYMAADFVSSLLSHTSSSCNAMSVLLSVAMPTPPPQPSSWASDAQLMQQQVQLACINLLHALATHFPGNCLPIDVYDAAIMWLRRAGNVLQNSSSIAAAQARAGSSGVGGGDSANRKFAQQQMQFPPAGLWAACPVATLRLLSLLYLFRLRHKACEGEHVPAS